MRLTAVTFALALLAIAPIAIAHHSRAAIYDITVEFVDEGERILLRIEEYDLTRVIHMMNAPTSGEPTSLGYSTGRWDGDSLVVTTSSILAPQFSAGIPLSESARVEERFELSDDQARLNFRVTVTDPDTFIEPVTREKYWTWIPGVEIQPYECFEGFR